MTIKPKTRKASAAKRAAPKAATKKASGEPKRQHGDEQYEIERELSRLIPQDFGDVRELLGFAIDMREGGFRTDGADQMMLKSILESLHNVTSAQIP